MLGIPQTGMTGQGIEIGVPLQNRDIFTNGNSRNQTVDELAHGFSALPTLAIESGRIFVIFRPGWSNNRAGQ